MDGMVSLATDTLGNSSLPRQQLSSIRLYFVNKQSPLLSFVVLIIVDGGRRKGSYTNAIDEPSGWNSDEILNRKILSILDTAIGSKTWDWKRLFVVGSFIISFESFILMILVPPLPYSTASLWLSIDNNFLFTPIRMPIFMGEHHNWITSGMKRAYFTDSRSFSCHRRVHQKVRHNNLPFRWTLATSRHVFWKRKERLYEAV